MYKELIKDLLKIKLKVADSAINVLPPECKKQICTFRNSLLKAVHEVTGEYLDDKPSKEEEKSVKSITID